ncbi:putative membrane protein [Motilibacter rhizosphaerae]|uniref:Putative membrane protein n=1 Tax=Motilibacter rhizosphaerae TaxID=598652 RepID=A0A4V2F499_9ACTN|nr:TMEM175 family protein [Motilibacter rhizosphaerae]RZS86867.1 putative membrane protein [Motilibacter rhizosphaerae]
MPTSRLEAFTDGVLAIIITIMVLELKVPEQTTWAAVHDELPVLLSYVLSFIFVGIYWNNHHHMLHATDRVDGLVLWANLHLLFWLSLVPWAAGFMGEHHFDAVPVALYGAIQLAAAIAYFLLQTCIIRLQGEQSLVRIAVGSDLKGKLSPVLCLLGIALTPLSAWAGLAAYVVLASAWLVPDRRIERVVAGRAEA